ncbi:uncharacterized protein LOC143915917 [Arctopsyche grandis]|uniref:uncharacterized protein LOC143915917 n=1 Tax=Arctopsyche grandis TaxID=121162 RepID=UPI00406D9660
MINSFVTYFLILPSFVFCQTSNFYLSFNNSALLRTGLSFPPHIQVVEGHDVMFKLYKTASDQEKCMLKFPNFTMINVKDKADRIEQWSEKCGVKINNVQRNDEGVWRLISEGKKGKTEALFALLIKENRVDINEHVEISYMEDESALLHFGSNNVSYCFMSQSKASDNTFLHANCSTYTGKVTRGLQGSWIVKMGVPGRMDEERSESKLSIAVEDVDVGYVDNISENSVHMYCNLKNSNKILKFCRFERYRDGVGFNLADGIGKGRYSYFGDGLSAHHCGIMIRSVSSGDYGNWKCSIGLPGANSTTYVIDRILMLHKPAVHLLSRLLNAVLRSYFYHLESDGRSVCTPAGLMLIYNWKTKQILNSHQMMMKMYAIKTSCPLHDPQPSNKPQNKNLVKNYSKNSCNQQRCALLYRFYQNMRKFVVVPFEILFISVLIIEIGYASRFVQTKDDTKILLSRYGKELKITCNANATILYCSVIHPNGTEFTPINDHEDSLPYSYDDTRLSVGQCVVTLKESSYQDSGMWKCQMGQMKPANVELLEVIEVRVTNAIASIDSTIQAKPDQTVSLTCITAEGQLLLKYCRFSTPAGTRFNIDETITYDKAILNQYYFQNDSSLYRGDCAISIKKVSSEHYGRWTCSAMIEDEATEYSSYIILESGGNKMSTASVAGLSVGLVLLVVVVAVLGLAIWKKSKYSNMNPNASLDMTARSTIESPTVRFTNRPSNDSAESDSQLTLGLDVHGQASYSGSRIY